MKFTFQTVLVTFVVTLVHLVILATLSPIGADASSQMSKSESEPEVEEVQSFPIVNEIPLPAAPEQTGEATAADEKELEAGSVPREERVSPPRAANLVEVSRGEKSQTLPREESPASENKGPYEIRQITPKPRS